MTGTKRKGPACFAVPRGQRRSQEAQCLAGDALQIALRSFQRELEGLSQMMAVERVLGHLSSCPHGRVGRTVAQPGLQLWTPLVPPAFLEGVPRSPGVALRPKVSTRGASSARMAIPATLLRMEYSFGPGRPGAASVFRGGVVGRPFPARGLLGAQRDRIRARVRGATRSGCDMTILSHLKEMID